MYEWSLRMISYRCMWILGYFSKISINNSLRYWQSLVINCFHKEVNTKSLQSLGTSQDCRLWQSPLPSVISVSYSTITQRAGRISFWLSRCQGRVFSKQAQLSQEEIPQWDQEAPDVCSFPGTWANPFSAHVPKLRSLPEWRARLGRKRRNSETLFFKKWLNSHVDTL